MAIKALVAAHSGPMCKTNNAGRHENNHFDYGI